jgi:hypothetical protein
MRKKSKEKLNKLINEAFRQRATQTKIFKTIQNERDFQDNLFGNQEMSVDRCLILLQVYLNMAQRASVLIPLNDAIERKWPSLYEKRKSQTPLQQLRKMAALIVKCFEHNGVPER